MCLQNKTTHVVSLIDGAPRLMAGDALRPHTSRWHSSLSMIHCFSRSIGRAEADEPPEPPAASSRIIGSVMIARTGAGSVWRLRDRQPQRFFLVSPFFASASSSSLSSYASRCFSALT